EITDDIAITENLYWANDNVEIFLDEDNSGGGHQHNNASNAFAFHINRMGEAIDLYNSGEYTTTDDHVFTQITEIENNKFIWEIRIALMDDSFNPSNVNIARSINANEVIGFTMSVIDADQANNRENFLGSVDTAEHIANQGYLSADGFGALILNSIPE
ncbi:MAG: hypothetical protein HRU38_07615, partial [Saccharospirillaceae bacterium]|nr:hypothetical protein [Saccharospirillaceae bacterium]